jgi:hypothetical protein
MIHIRAHIRPYCSGECVESEALESIHERDVSCSCIRQFKNRGELYKILFLEPTKLLRLEPTQLLHIVKAPPPKKREILKSMIKKHFEKHQA